MFGCNCHERMCDLEANIHHHKQMIAAFEDRIVKLEHEQIVYIYSEDWKIALYSMPTKSTLSKEYLILKNRFNQLISFLNLKFEHQSEKTVLKKLDKKK